MSLESKFKNMAKADDSTSSGWQKKAARRLANRTFHENSRKVALRILEALDKKGMTQMELAEKMGVSRQHVSQIVKGEVNFTFETIGKLESALEIRVMTIHGPGEILTDEYRSEKLFMTMGGMTNAYNVSFNPWYGSEPDDFYSFQDWLLGQTKVITEDGCHLHFNPCEIQSFGRYTGISPFIPDVKPNLARHGLVTTTTRQGTSVGQVVDNYIKTESIAYRQLQMS